MLRQRTGYVFLVLEVALNDLYKMLKKIFIISRMADLREESSLVQLPFKIRASQTSLFCGPI